MQATIEQKQLNQIGETERQKSFDVVASVRMLRYDIDNFGRVLPETMQQVYDEELTYIAEGIDRHSYTAFSLQEQDGGLVYFREGKWQPYTGMLLRGLETAKQEQREDSRKSFLTAHAEEDLAMGYRMQKLEVGESMVWYRGFADKECSLYGQQFVKDVGMQPDRRMGFIWRAERLEDGSVLLESQTVDNSDNEAFDEALRSHELNPLASLETVVSGYDRVLGQKNKGDYRNGRLQEAGEIEANAWEFVKENKILINCYFEDLVGIAESDLSGEALENAKKRLTYATWGQLKKRLDGLAVEVVEDGFDRQTNQWTMTPDAVRMERDIVYRELSSRGEVMFGCGGSVGGDKDLLGAAEADVFNMIFGSEGKSIVKDTTMRCVNCPECRTFHDEVKKEKGKLVCDNPECKLAGSEAKKSKTK